MKFFLSNKTRLFPKLFSLLVAVAYLQSPSAVIGSTFVVTDLADMGNFILPGTLRWAITNASASGGGNIVFSNVSGTIRPLLALPPITNNINIIGPGANILSVSGDHGCQVFVVSNGVTCNISGLTLCYGSVNNWFFSLGGAAILNNGSTLHLADCILSDNVAHTSDTNSIFGGAVASINGTLSCSNCIFTRNRAMGIGSTTTSGNPAPGGAVYGGAIFCSGGYLTLINCNVSSNTVTGGPGRWSWSLYLGSRGGDGWGGAVYQSNTICYFTNTTFNNNTTSGGRGGNDGSGYNSWAGSDGLACGGAVAGIAGSTTFTGCTVSNNSALGLDYGHGGGTYGGGIYQDGGLLALSNCRLARNTAIGGYGTGYAGDYPEPGSGGAVYTTASAGFTNCSFFANASAGGSMWHAEFSHTAKPGYGGAIYNSGSLALVACTCWNNTVSGGNGYSGGNDLYITKAHAAEGAGGGVYNSGSLTVLNSTFTANTATGGTDWLGAAAGRGGAVCNDNSAQLDHCTVAQNTASSSGGGLFNGSWLWLKNSIVANNSPDNCYGAFSDAGYNLVNTDPRLSPLADNGGSTPTMALLPDSPAIDQGSADGLFIDQRGKTRPSDFPALANAADGSDIGAYELLSPEPTNSIPAPYGIVAWWPGDGSAQDIIGTNNGTLMNDATYATGMVGGAFSFDGVDDYMLAAQNAFSNIVNNFTMEFWAYPTASRAVTAEANSGVTGSGGQRYAIFPYFTDFDTGAGVSVGTNGISVFEHGSYYLPSPLVYQGPITGWTHVAVVYTNKQPLLYVNGVLARTGLTSARSSVHPSPGLGGYNSYGYYAGLLDEVSIYNRALTTEEIGSIYLAGSAGKCLVLPSPKPNRVVGWPANGLGMTNMPAGLTNATKIAAGVYHSLALKADGTVVGWGENDFGQTEAPADLTNVTALAAGWGTSLALKRDGTLAEWGWDGGYGLKSTAESLTNITAISACWDCLMALKADGTVLVWGKSTHGETNVPTGLTDVRAIAGGGFHCLALRCDGTVVAWGDNGYNQSNVPTGLGTVVSIAAGGNHSLALRQDGTVVAWGDNSSGQTNVPPDLAEVVAISGGGAHSLALKSNGSLTAWGDNSNGQTNVPANLTNVIAIAAGGYHNLALTGSRAPWTRFKNIHCDANGQVHFTVSGLCGDVYQVLGSTNLINWQILGSITNGTGAVDFVDPSATDCSQRFYRIKMP